MVHSIQAINVEIVYDFVWFYSGGQRPWPVSVKFVIHGIMWHLACILHSDIVVIFSTKHPSVPWNGHKHTSY